MRRHGATMNRAEGGRLDMMERMNELTGMLVTLLRNELVIVVSQA